MRTLEKIVKTNGTLYKQIKRESWKAMYRAESGQYEVFKVKVLPATEMFGNPVPEREKFPGNEDFGKFAWCLSSREKADEIYDGLIKKVKK